MKKLLLLFLPFIYCISYASVNASFTCSSTRGCSPLVVDMMDQSAGPVSSWRWDFGNGNTSTLRTPSATYFAPGQYIVKLIVSDGSQRDSTTKTVTVFSLPVVNLMADRTTACQGDSVRFTNQITLGSAPIRQYAWDFGNGIASRLTTVVYKYPHGGTYDVTLVVQDTNGCIGHLTHSGLMHINAIPSATFVPTPQTSCANSQLINFTNQSQGSNLSYRWKFGDSTFSTAAAPSHLFSYGRYNPTLIVTDQNGCIDTFQKKVAIINVQANFAASKTTICVGEAVSFFNMSPMPGTNWGWRFGDGSVSNKKNPKKVYSNPGLYDITFIVRDTICSDSSVIHGFITVTHGFTLNFSANAQSSCVTPFTVNFTSTASTSVNYSWDFGDGNMDTIANPTNTYTNASIFPVTLTAVDTSGCTVIVSQPGMINTAKPDVKFICSDTVACFGTPIRFFNRTTNAVRYHWDFGDGDTSNAVIPTHTYRRYGKYTISLTAWDSIGCDSTIVKASFVRIDSAKVDFAISQRFSLSPPLVAAFTSTANRQDIKYSWDFGDGTSDTVHHPTHVYFHPGKYTVKLIGKTLQGCADTVTYHDAIEVQGPSATFTQSTTNGCMPLTVRFDGTVSANVSTVLCDMGDGTVYNDSIQFNYTYKSARVFHPNFLVTDHVGCSVAYALDSIMTHASPIMHLHDTSICAGRSVLVNPGSDLYNWSSTNIYKGADTVNLGQIAGASGGMTIIPSDSMVYNVTATNAYGCKTSGSFKINVDPMPELTIQDTLKLCKSQSATIGLVQSAYRVLWSPAKYLNDVNDIHPVCTASASIEYTATAYNQSGCSVSGKVPVLVSNHVPATISRDTLVCPGSEVQLHVRASDPDKTVNYTWLPSANMNNVHTQNPVVKMGMESETFRVVLNELNCTTDTAKITVRVAPAAEVSLHSAMVASIGSELPISIVSSNLVSYIWSAHDSLSCTECNNPVLFPTHSQYIHVSGQNSYGCSVKDSMFIHAVDCDPSSIFVANIFSPNNDGVNDKLYMRSKTMGEISYFRIYNRWGAIVFETSDMTEGWDGSVNSSRAEQGVYVYQIQGKCRNGYSVSTSGTVAVVR